MSDPASPLGDRTPVHYPESDGKPMGETPWHIDAIIHLRQALGLFFREAPDVYVGADMFLYYQEGDPRSCTCPDVFVTRGMSKEKKRGVYKLWEEGVAPQLVVEVTSKSSQREDLWQKRALYERLGVSEYLLFDPDGEYLEPRFQAFRLGEDGSYDPIDLEANETYQSPTFGLGLRPEGQLLRVLDAAGQPLPSLEESAQRVDEEARRAEEATRRAEAAERELRRLKTHLGDPDT